MSYSESSDDARGRFWPSFGPKLPLSKTSWLGITAALVVAAAVFLAWMLWAGPWADGGDSFSTTESTRSEAGLGGGAFAFATPAPAPTAAPGGFRGDDAFAVTGEAVKDGQRSGAAVPASGPPIPVVTNGLVQRQIISQGSMSVQVADVPTAAARVRAIAEGVGGFVEQLSSNGVGEFQQSTITVRVPQAEFFSVFEQIKALGEVQNENAGSVDVTEQFIDLEARLKSAQREELSLLSLLDRANVISEILTIERELTRIRGELERLQGQLNFLERRRPADRSPWQRPAPSSAPSAAHLGSR